MSFLPEQAKAQFVSSEPETVYIEALADGAGYSDSLTPGGLPVPALCVGEITDDLDELDGIYWQVGTGDFFSFELGPIILARFFMLDDPTIMSIRVFQLNQHEEYADEYTIARYVDFMYSDRVPAIDFATQIPIQSGEFTNPGMAVHYGNIHGGTYLDRNLGITSLSPHVAPNYQDLIDEYVPEVAHYIRPKAVLRL